MLSTLIEVLGIVALVVAGALVAPALGFAVAGVCLVALGVALGRPAVGSKPDSEKAGPQ